ncbi:hypothetical protein BC830DRAFT_128589 [Chytriomyces sp. MP71]|nr:hypothetical protein BC830DRAFT_128589 [Chytriomyces sp. MP71]
MKPVSVALIPLVAMMALASSPLYVPPASCPLKITITSTKVSTVLTTLPITQTALSVLTKTVTCTLTSIASTGTTCLVKRTPGLTPSVTASRIPRHEPPTTTSPSTLPYLTDLKNEENFAQPSDILSQQLEGSNMTTTLKLPSSVTYSESSSGVTSDAVTASLKISACSTPAALNLPLPSGKSCKEQKEACQKWCLDNNYDSIQRNQCFNDAEGRATQWCQCNDQTFYGIGFGTPTIACPA